jgi:hypothetical protein
MTSNIITIWSTWLPRYVRVGGDPLGLGPRQQQTPHPLLPFANPSLFRRQEAQSHTAIFRVIKGQKTIYSNSTSSLNGSRHITKALFGTCHEITCHFPCNKLTSSLSWPIVSILLGITPTVLSISKTVVTMYITIV